MERRLEKVMRAICACALALTVTGCVETAPEVAISEPDPELNFVRGYRSAADECQLVGETAFGEKAVMPYLVAIDTMPKVAFAPLFVAWLGFGIESKVALAAFIATFPIVVGTAAGLHSADENARMLFKTMGASRMQTLIKMKLPTGLPQIFTGLKIGAVGVMAGAITGEFLGGGKGFGELIRVAASQLNTPRVFSLILYLSLVGLALYLIVQWTQRRVVFWQKETVGAHDA